MAKRLLDEDGLREVWSRVVGRSIRVVPMSESDYEELSQDDKEKDVLYIVDGGFYFRGSKITGSGEGSTDASIAADKVLFDNRLIGMDVENVQDAIDVLFTSVSDGKELLASAITDKGVSTNKDDSFKTMSDNISKIQGSSGSTPDGLYNISVHIDPSDGGNVVGGGSASEGFLSTVRAIKNPGWEFHSWKENDEIVSRESNYTFVVENDRSLHATFLNSPEYVAGAFWRLAKTVEKATSCVAYGNGVFVVLCSDSRNVYYSYNGKDWTTKTSALPSGDGWSGVAYGNGVFSAISKNGGLAAYSSDGITWTKSSMPSVVEWSAITFGAGKFVAVSTGSTVFAYSTDGKAWNGTSTNSAYTWETVTYGPEDGGYFLAGRSGSRFVTWSRDGISWTQVSLTNLNSLSSWHSNRICYGDGKFVFVNLYKRALVLTLDDAISPPSLESNWAMYNFSDDYEGSNCIVFGDGKFIILPTGYSLVGRYSEDGSNWLPSVAPKLANYVSAAYGDGVFVACSDSGDIIYTWTGNEEI